LFRHTALVPPHAAAPATFPSWQPRHAIDHILTSSSIEIERLWTLPHPVSDHLPLAARIKLPSAA
jgi:endonuclease/exonuclease/phosphatase family metal-dependent hydrolase